MAGFDKAALDRLMALGRRRGHLTTGDLESELPVATMAPDEIALVIVHLEEAGIPVEVDAALLTGDARPTAPSDGGLVFPESVAPPPATQPLPHGGGMPSPGAPAPDPAAPAGDARPRSAHWAVAVAGLLVLALLLATLYATAA